MTTSENRKPAPNASQGINETVLNAIARLAHQRPKEHPVRILELASGRGYLAKLVYSRLEAEGLPFEYLCSDIDPTQLQLTDRQLEYVKLDVQEPFPDIGTFDIVIAVELIEHIENQFHLVREVSKILNPDGLFIFSSPNILSLASRMRYLLTGCFDFFRRPFNEHHLNMGHVNPLSPLLAIFLLRKNGFLIDSISSITWSIGRSIAWLPLIPLIITTTHLSHIFRERGPDQRNRNRETVRIILNPNVLLGKTLVYQARKKLDFIATPDMWHRADDRFSR